jgi:hypothetical protein
MNMKKLFTFLMAAVTINVAVAQKKEKEVKYEKLFYKDVKMDAGDISISVDNAVSTEGETKFKLKIINKTGDYIIYKPEESKFIVNGKEMKATEKWLTISPNESNFRIINLKGAGFNSIKNYSFVLDGLYRVVVAEKSIAAPDFRLPASQNDFKAEKFTCTLSSLTKESDKTEAKFKCAYNGDKIGFVYPSKAAVKMPDGNEYANAKSKASGIMLSKGQEDSFTLQWDRMEGGKAMDMQKVEMIIKWREAFNEASLEKMKSETIELEFDEAMSNAKK